MGPARPAPGRAARGAADLRGAGRSPSRRSRHSRRDGPPDEPRGTEGPPNHNRTAGANFQRDPKYSYPICRYSGCQQPVWAAGTRRTIPAGWQVGSFCAAHTGGRAVAGQRDADRTSGRHCQPAGDRADGAPAALGPDRCLGGDIDPPPPTPGRRPTDRTADRGARQQAPCRHGAAGRRRADSCPAASPRDGEEGELSYWRPQPSVPTPEPEEEKSTLPQWAQELFQRNPPVKAPAGQSGPTAWSVQPPAAEKAGPAGQMMEWTAPGAVPPGAPIALRTRQPEAQPPQTAAQPPHITEGEVRRAADQIYKIIEERLRRELRRGGR